MMIYIRVRGRGDNDIGPIEMSCEIKALVSVIYVDTLVYNKFNFALDVDSFHFPVVRISLLGYTIGVFRQNVYH